MYLHSELFTFCRSVFIKMGCSSEHADLASTILLTSDLRGIDSHGLARLSGYVRLWKEGRINTQPNIRLVHETPSTGTVDGDSGLGLIVAPFAMEVAIAKAKEVGSGWVSVKNSNHFGIAGYHAELALPHDMIGMAMTNASPLVAPTWSRERMLGTNPIAVAIPSNKETPFIADFATTTAANGKLEILQRKELDTPEGWVQDGEGRMSTNAHELKEGGSLLPLGSDFEHGSHKGYSLGSIVDIFSAVLSGANYGPWAPPFVSFLPLAKDPVGEGLGHFLGAMRIDGFRPASEFKENMDKWIRRFRESEPAEGYEKVLIPGDPEREAQKTRQVEGIPLNPKVQEDLRELSKEFGIPFPG